MKSPYPFYRSSNPLLSDHVNDLRVFEGKPFWCYGSVAETGNVSAEPQVPTCCFNHIIGLLEKNNKTYPIFDYELDVIKAIEQHRNIWIKKASGIGATELILRYLTWKILVNNELEYKNIFIVSGTFVHHANSVKVRMQSLFNNHFPLIQLDSKFTDLWIKNTNIKIFPSRNVKDLRGWTDVSYLFIDEADHFEPSVNSELLHAITRYEEKSNCTTIMVSTPNRPGGLFESIEKDPKSKYHKIFLLVDVGLDKIFDRKEIEKKRLEPEFPREYQGLYLGKIGNVLTPQQVDHCIELGKEYSISKYPVSLYTSKSAGVDFGFSSSGTGIVVVENMSRQYRDGIVKKEVLRVVDCHLIEKGDPNQIVNLCWDKWRKYGYMNTWFYCDAANAGMVNLMKSTWDESTQWTRTEDVSSHNNRIIPVSFNTNHKAMLSNLHLLASKGYLAVDPKHDKLITSLRTAYAEELTLDKKQTSYDDLLDALRLALFQVKIE